MEAEQPHWYFIANAGLDILGYDISFGLISNLRESFSFATNFKQIGAVKKKVTLYAANSLSV